jgi:uncharacterized membrane protein/nitrite reductase/ring-hydroxylating ferredoxin subunit
MHAAERGYETMRSRASYNGHPIHPTLIPFPFAFFTGAFAFDAAGWLFAEPAFWTTGRHLAVAGIVSALAAAVPGFVDYLYTVPPHSSAKQRATRHMLLNLTVVAAFTGAWMARPEDPHIMLVALEAVAVALLAASGWMGGVLVNRNQIGVDHRYADAGKWKELVLDPPSGDSVAVATADELKPDQMKLLRIGERRIVLARTERGYAAFDDRCTHKGGSLAGGAMICGTVQCPWHGSQFDVHSGAVTAGPAKEGITVYRVETRGPDVYVFV